MSTQKQGLGVSLDAQVDAITAFASQHHLEIIKWFEEKETAAKRGRPIFNQMLRQLKKGEASGLIMHKIDRSARNLRDWALVSELPNLGIDIFFATESLDFRSRGGRLAANLQAVIAEDYIYNLREECIKGLNGRLKQGLYPFRAPIGYLDNGRGKPKTPCPTKSPLIRQAFSLYATGQYSMRSLQVKLERLGLRNQAGRPLSQHGVETILGNPFYTGMIVIKRTGAVYEGIHDPIVTARVFQRVQDIKSGKAGKKVTRHNHLYRGLFRCGLCDSAMSPERQKGRVYYRCQTPCCATKTVREDAVTDVVVAALRKCELTQDQADKLKQDWYAWLVNDDRDQKAKSLDLRIGQCQARLTRLTDLLIDTAITRDEHDSRKRALTLELTTVREERKRAEQFHLSDDEMEKFLELMKNLAQLHISAKPAEKRWILENCFSNRTVVGNEICLEPYSWLQVSDFDRLTPMVNHNGPLLELLHTGQIPIEPEHTDAGLARCIDLEK
ncbi:recombinase family protein [Aliiroseovarius sp. F47248L]|nr:recombinase family protein [Aliiroseovarius sp. F47248L]